jgi:hypothetical protein
MRLNNEILVALGVPAAGDGCATTELDAALAASKRTKHMARHSRNQNAEKLNGLKELNEARELVRLAQDSRDSGA